jgi:hypothetical protein
MPLSGTSSLRPDIQQWNLPNTPPKPYLCIRISTLPMLTPPTPTFALPPYFADQHYDLVRHSIAPKGSTARTQTLVSSASVPRLPLWCQDTSPILALQ